ncbi:probable RNA polymerase II nuclear localization protein SLC7A6OS [Eupeodes corollae]|uniref:probable RNA polymerase II nuclear localization protein SLC7A6OS n=1 Tax=Eupeodes corollae TaxID=290404 RepID=UPI0024919907|nr:probable RNA polymerase II nuclear localization protein SLC7A6OS [Eupeodes corollae]
MPAVVRVKRRIDEEPLGAFVLNGKKRRIDESDTNSAANNTTPLDLFDTSKDEISTILKFAGTVQSQDEKVTTQIARLTKDEAIELAKKHRQQPISATERGRQEMRAQSNQNRFKVVNCFRAIDTETEDANPKEITIVDIEKQPLTTTIEDPANIATTSSNQRQHEPQPSVTPATTIEENFTPTDGDGYVYDLYLPENEQQADDVDYTDNYLSVRAYEELVYEDCYNDEEGEDSEDSNEENYFRNDYPDEEDDDADNDSMGFRDMRRAIETIDFDANENELSSDDEDYHQARSGFVFSIDAGDEDFADDVDYRDVDRYGTAYARYKKRILRDMQAENSEDEEDRHNGDISEQSDYVDDENSEDD